VAVVHQGCGTNATRPYSDDTGRVMPKSQRFQRANLIAPVGFCPDFFPFSPDSPLTKTTGAEFGINRF
jgi:hypothetical protein